jgi:hypothetical protein
MYERMSDSLIRVVVTGVPVDGASQSHNFGPLNLLARMLKKPHNGSLGHNSILPHLYHFSLLLTLLRPFYCLLIQYILLSFTSYLVSPSCSYSRLVNLK